MSLELNLRFPDPRHLFVTLDRQSVGPLDFAVRTTAKDREEIRWYLETYAANYTTDADDAEARRIEAKLSEWGSELFDATFRDSAARHLFSVFRERTDQDRMITISAEHSAILSLTWEVLCAPERGYLFNDTPRISIRRRVAKATGCRAFRTKEKERLRLLFVTSRPLDAGFIDPRAEAKALMDAVEQQTPRRIEIEFLRPATFRNLVERLEAANLPDIDIIHFDGHGAFDTNGSFGDKTPNTGYLVFERESGLKQFVSPEFWRRRLGNCSVSIVVLSACQSAAIGGSEDSDEAEEPMGSVAYGLTALGVPAVLAMSHSLLVETAGQLFGNFYRHLAEGKDIGTALDNARDYLMRHPQKHEVQRGTQRVRLTVHDWFLPALYQASEDVPLLNVSAKATPNGLADVESTIDYSECPEGDTDRSPALPDLEEAGFFGRKRELWDIERWFAAGTRRISITGFGGQGKTALAVEAARWQRRTGMFERVAFVSYAAFQGVDAVGYAVAVLGTVLGESLTNANAATAALMKRATLVILDNLEDLGQAGLVELLGVAKTWSECGGSRVLLTSRAPDFEHPDYPLQGSLEHRCKLLSGLNAEDALSYFQSLMKLPPQPQLPLPDRDALLKLFEMVSAHPLAIRLLAVQLKTRRIAELDQRLESLLAEGDEKDKSLLASLRLSLDRLDAATKTYLPRLGVFQGGAMEDVLLLISGLGRVANPKMEEAKQLLAAIERSDMPAMLRITSGIEVSREADMPKEWVDRMHSHAAAIGPQLIEYINRDVVNQRPRSPLADGVTDTTWPQLKTALVRAALVQVESLAAHNVPVPYLRFHPALAPLLWSQLAPTDRDALTTAYRRWYYDLSRGLRGDDTKYPRQMRAVALKELPNLLHAVEGALEAGAEWAVDFADNVIRFLGLLGLTRDAAALAEQARARAGE